MPVRRFIKFVVVVNYTRNKKVIAGHIEQAMGPRAARQFDMPGIEHLVQVAQLLKSNNPNNCM